MLCDSLFLKGHTTVCDDDVVDCFHNSAHGRRAILGIENVDRGGQMQELLVGELFGRQQLHRRRQPSKSSYFYTEYTLYKVYEVLE